MSNAEVVQELRWKKFPVLDDGFVCLVDVMGDDSSVVQAARVSYGQDVRLHSEHPEVVAKLEELFPNGGESHYTGSSNVQEWSTSQFVDAVDAVKKEHLSNDRTLLRYLMRHRHTTPFEMCEIKLLVRVPMDCWRQWIRHRMANVNEYSTRYTEAIDSRQTTPPDQWRSQSKSNKQGSGDFITEWPENWYRSDPDMTIGEQLSAKEARLHELSQEVYEERIHAGVAKEQARKDLPLSTYTEAYWKIDLHNLLHFLSLRMDSHAQKEIRDYATVIGVEIVQKLFPLVWEAFVDYRMDSRTFTGPEMFALASALFSGNSAEFNPEQTLQRAGISNKREQQEFLDKLKYMNLLWINQNTADPESEKE